MFIYQIVNTVNNKKYIGLTSNSDINKRWFSHRTMLKGNKYSNSFLQKEWNLFGSESFTFEVLEKCEDVEQLCERERDLIENNKSLFNEGGYNIHTGGQYHVTPEYIRNIIKEKNSLPVNKYSLDGVFICEYPSITKAAEDNNCSIQNIVTCLKGITKTAFGFQWRYKDDETKVEKVASSNYRRGSGFRKEILQYDKDNRLINKHNSIAEASKAVGVAFQSLQQCLYGKSKTSAGYVWKYA